MADLGSFNATQNGTARKGMIYVESPLLIRNGESPRLVNKRYSIGQLAHNIPEVNFLFENTCFAFDHITTKRINHTKPWIVTSTVDSYGVSFKYEIRHTVFIISPELTA